MTPQQHHNKAAKIHEQASIHHKNAAMSHELGDVKAAAIHARLAYEYAAQATEYGNLVDGSSDLMDRNNKALNAPLQGAPEQEVDETRMRVLNIL